MRALSVLGCSTYSAEAAQGLGMGLWVGAQSAKGSVGCV